MNNIDIKKRFFYTPEKMNKITITCSEIYSTDWSLNVYFKDDTNSLLQSIGKTDSATITTQLNKLYICTNMDNPYQLNFTANGCAVTQNSSLSIGTGDYCYEVELTSSEATLSVWRYIERP